MTPAKDSSPVRSAPEPAPAPGEGGGTLANLVSALQERAKELECLYEVEELTSDSNVPLQTIFRGIIEALPNGWQYPDVCQVRITHEGEIYETEGYTETPWVQRAPLLVFGEPGGTIEVSYRAAMPSADEGPFLHPERKLIDTVADRLSSCITHRRLMDSMREWRAAHREASRSSTHEWSVILDLLRRTDQSLLVRIARKMINHLCWSGVQDAEELLERFRVGPRGDGSDVFQDSNQPRQVAGNLPTPALVDEVFRVAAAHLSDNEIVTCVHRWIKQDRASFLVNTLENYHTTLSEVADAIHRYQHATHGEVELSNSTRKGLRVSLVRRFLSDQLEYVNIAKNYVEIHDFHELLGRMIFPTRGHGKIGGKSSGLFLASQIIRQHGRDTELLGRIRVPRTWYLTSDGLHDFVYCNHLEDVFTQKYKDIDEIRQEYPDIVQVFKHSGFSTDIIKGLSMALDDLGDHPLIVRSSSLLEDRFGAAFSGKYKSLFLANQGTKQQRLSALTDAIAEVYASAFSPDPIEYRTERNLLDFQEGMGIMIQQVVGNRIGDMFLPAFAGVAFSHNEFRWSPRIAREDGLVRLVPGLGTRAVDRVGDDFPVLVSPGQPGLRANASAEEVARYAPRYMDVINLRQKKFETVEVIEFLRTHGDEIPAIEQLISIYEHGRLRVPMRGGVDFAQDDVVVTFEGLLTRTPFVKQVHALLTLLQHELNTPVDVEFASDGTDLYLLQCRAQTAAQHAKPVPIPRDIARERIVFSARRYVSNGSVPNITHIVYVDPDRYADLGRREDLIAVGRAVGKLNKLLPKRQFILMGPGRWGSRGDIKLGVQVTYSDINNTAALIEIARKKGEYTPDLSFGTHFFQDLVEANIRYLPLYPDEDGSVFNELFLTRAPNILSDMLPECAELGDTVRVIDVPRAADGCVLRLLMNADLDEALAVLAPPTDVLEPVDAGVADSEPQQGQHWRWRLRMAERIASQLDPHRFGVNALYVFGSTKNATAGPASDIDLLVHFAGTAEQRAALERWCEGWSLCLSEVNYLRTGYRTEGLLDVHIITDEDIAANNSFAAKINAITDAARPLALPATAPAESVARG